MEKGGNLSQKKKGQRKKKHRHDTNKKKHPVKKINIFHCLGAKNMVCASAGSSPAVPENACVAHRLGSADAVYAGGATPAAAPVVVVVVVLAVLP